MGKKKGLINQASDEASNILLFPLLALIIFAAFVYFEPYANQLIDAFNWLYGDYIKPVVVWMEPFRTWVQSLFS